MASPDIGDPAPDFRRALKLAREQGAAAYEQRAAHSLAVLTQGETIA